SAAHILKAAVLDGEAARTDDVLQPGLESEIRIANSDAFEIVVIRREDIKQVVSAIAVEDRFAVTGSFDHDRFFGRAALSQEVGFDGKGAKAYAIAMAIDIL